MLYSLQISLPFPSLRFTVCVPAAESPRGVPELCSEVAAGARGRAERVQIPILKHRPATGQKGGVFASVSVRD